jgi:hypothetical protein
MRYEYFHSNPDAVLPGLCFCFNVETICLCASCYWLPLVGGITSFPVQSISKDEVACWVLGFWTEIQILKPCLGTLDFFPLELTP